MPTVFIANTAIQLPSRFASGDIASENAANVLNDIQLKRTKAKLRWLLQKGDINTDGIQIKAMELMNAELLPGATLDDDDNNDPIMDEALNIAREVIIRRMAAEGLPVPKGIDQHAKALVDAMPQIQEKARLRIEARFKAAEAAIEGAI